MFTTHNLSQFGSTLLIPYGIFALVVHLVFAIAVLQDGKRLMRHGMGTFLVAPGWWAFATFTTGVLAAGIYWVIHHSTLRRDRPPYEERQQ